MLGVEHSRYGFSFMWKAVECMSSAECHYHLMGMKRHVESFLVCVVGKMAGWCECVVVSFPSCLAGF